MYVCCHQGPSQSTIYMFVGRKSHGGSLYFFLPTSSSSWPSMGKRLSPTLKMPGCTWEIASNLFALFLESALWQKNFKLEKKMRSNRVATTSARVIFTPTSELNCSSVRVNKRKKHLQGKRLLRYFSTKGCDKLISTVSAKRQLLTAILQSKLYQREQ